MFYIEYSWQLALICVIIFIIMIYISKPQNTYINPQLNNTNKGIHLFFFLYIINSVCGFRSSDNYHIWNEFILANNFIHYEIDQFEEIFNQLAHLCNNDYFLWRFIIWTPACLLLYIVAKKNDLLNRNLLLAIAFFLGFASFTRAMLGHSLLLLGLVIYVGHNKIKYRKFIGLFIICISYYFHKSMYVNIMFALMAFFPFGEKSIKLSIIIFPILTIVTTYIINGISSGAFVIALGENVGGVGDRTYLYATQERAVLNAYGIVSKLITVIPQYLTLLYLYLSIYKRKLLLNDKDNKIFIYLFKLSYVSIYIASLFYFTDTSSFIYERFKYMGLFPLVFVLAKIWSIETCSNKWIKSIILMQLFALLWQNSYAIYNWYRL